MHGWGEIPCTFLPGLQTVATIFPGLPRHAGILLGSGDCLSLPYRPTSGNPAISFYPPPPFISPPPPVFTQQDLFMLTLFKFADGGRKKDRVE